MMASITISQSARSALLVVPLSRARIASFCAEVIPPFSTGRSANLAKDFSIPANPLSRNLCSTSSTVTSNPAVAQTCAMPEPISPQPRTPTFVMSISIPNMILSPRNCTTYEPEDSQRNRPAAYVNQEQSNQTITSVERKPGRMRSVNKQHRPVKEPWSIVPRNRQEEGGKG